MEGCFYCEEHHEGREAIMFKVGEMKAGTLYLFKDQAHKGRCVLALKEHRRELCECGAQELADFADDLALQFPSLQALAHRRGRTGRVHGRFYLQHAQRQIPPQLK